MEKIIVTVESKNDKSKFVVENDSVITTNADGEIVKIHINY